MKDKKQKWNEAYANAEFDTATAATVLADNAHLLPLVNKSPSANKKPLAGEESSAGKEPLTALDLACGRAGNAQFLANLGFEVDVVDISPVLLQGLQHFVTQQNLNIECIEHDIESDGILNKKYDVIVVSYFLNREFFPQIKASLKPNGLLLYQTWSQLRVDEAGPNNPNFRLAPSELLELCSGLKVILYRENGLEGDLSKGLRNEAMIIAKNT